MACWEFGSLIRPSADVAAVTTQLDLAKGVVARTGRSASALCAASAAPRYDIWGLSKRDFTDDGFFV